MISSRKGPTFGGPKAPLPKIENSSDLVKSQDFVQKGAYLGRAQGTPYQKQKIPRIWPTIFDEPCNFIFFNYFILFQYSRQEGGRSIPLAVSLLVMPIGNENLGVPRNVQCPIWTLDGQRPKFLDNFGQPSDICHFFVKNMLRYMLQRVKTNVTLTCCLQTQAKSNQKIFAFTLSQVASILVPLPIGNF